MEKSAVRILLVDDEPTMQKLVRQRLVNLGYTRVDVVTNGQAALDRLATMVKDGKPLGYNVVLSDVTMPVMNGIALLKAIKADPSLQSLTVVIMSSNDADPYEREVRALGAIGYLQKPFQQHTLEIMMDKVLDQLEH